MVSFDGETLGWDGHAVLPSLTLRISRGERIALLGRSGAGKSTLLGAVRDRITAERTALVPQNHGLVDPLSVFHNVWMGRLDDFSTARNLRTLVWPSKQERAEVDAVLSQTGLSGLDRRAVASLSGGQRQRVAVARALLRGGAVVLADEPVSAVDPSQGDALLGDLSSRFNTAVFALHDVGQALRFATRIIGLRAGAVELDAASADLDPATVMGLYR
ncbi:ATP-binding cassette domain-containing protein [Pseudoruegeria sp. SK021]|uniref:ATP-binding cassette domain-containing protein n=1 Tax=Pseudoruegeria sp. SK021 TaxID=1933035 RepID=UPI001F0AADA1|nr:ATP-binding cassette domain-containing protein [Pseudoruegeria sp. SK021]